MALLRGVAAWRCACGCVAHAWWLDEGVARLITGCLPHGRFGRRRFLPVKPILDRGLGVRWVGLRSWIVQLARYGLKLELKPIRTQQIHAHARARPRMLRDMGHELSSLYMGLPWGALAGATQSPPSFLPPSLPSFSPPRLWMAYAEDAGVGGAISWLSARCGRPQTELEMWQLAERYRNRRGRRAVGGGC
jgi:hypothetical protein